MHDFALGVEQDEGVFWAEDLNTSLAINKLEAKALLEAAGVKNPRARALEARRSSAWGRKDISRAKGYN